MVSALLCPWLSSNSSNPYPSVPPGIPNTSTHPALIRAGLGQVYEFGPPQGSLPLSLLVTLSCHSAPASCGLRTEPLIFSAALI